MYSVRLPRFVRTITFRLAVTQAILFAASAAALFAAVYWSMIGFATTQLKGEVAAELAVLAEERNTDGLVELIKTLEFRTKERGPEGHGYALVSPSGQRLAGGLRPASFGPGWQRLDPASRPAPSDDDAHPLIVLGQSLPTGEVLLVGRDTRSIDNVKEVITQTFVSASLVTLALAMLGGIMTSLGFLRRVEEINATTRRIMAGDLNKRIATKGNGDEFDRLAGNLNDMLDRVQSLMDGLRQVSNDIAHDLRTPLAHLRQRLEGARSGARTLEFYDAALEAAIEDTDAILRMFAALLRIAQVEAGTRRSGFGDVDLSGVFTTILDVYAPVAEDNGQTLTGEIQPGLRLRGDRELLMQMLANLVENAIRHSGSGAEIRMQLASQPTGLRATVSDDGPGIAPDARDRVFRRFFRTESSRASEGHGLGLSLVRAVADLHDTTIELSDNGPGLLVTLRYGALTATADDVRSGHAARPPGHSTDFVALPLAQRADRRRGRRL